MRVAPDGGVSVSAPNFVSKAEIVRFIEERREWVEKATARSAERRETTPCDDIRDGGSIRLLGKSVPIKVNAGTGNSVVVRDGVFNIVCKDPSDEKQLAGAVLAWQRRAAKDYLSDITRQYLPIFAPYGVKMPTITIKRMTSRWGSCNSRDGRVNYNLQLIGVPRECAEYVVLHELTHYINGSHDRAFYAFIERYMPDWKKRKKLLNSVTLSK